MKFPNDLYGLKKWIEWQGEKVFFFKNLSIAVLIKLGNWEDSLKIDFVYSDMKQQSLGDFLGIVKMRVQNQEPLGAEESLRYMQEKFSDIEFGRIFSIFSHSGMLWGATDAENMIIALMYFDTPLPSISPQS